MMISRLLKQALTRLLSRFWFARLEDDLGIDPFTISANATVPLTVGDFVRAYENVHA